MRGLEGEPGRPLEAIGAELELATVGTAAAVLVRFCLSVSRDHPTS